MSGPCDWLLGPPPPEPRVFAELPSKATTDTATDTATDSDQTAAKATSTRRK